MYLVTRQVLNKKDVFVVDSQMYRVVGAVGDGLVCEWIGWDAAEDPVPLDLDSIIKVNY